MTDELICPIHGPYDASYGSCPYHTKDTPQPVDPAPSSQDALPTIIAGREQQPEHAVIIQKPATPPASRHSAKKGFLDLDEGEAARAEVMVQDDLTVIESGQTEFHKPSSVLGLFWIKTGAQRGRTYPIKPGDIIGRTTGMVVLNDPKVSNPHARITVENDQFIIWDFGSGNGTYVNGERIREATPLKENDQLKIGDTVFVVKILA